MLLYVLLSRLSILTLRLCKRSINIIILNTFQSRAALSLLAYCYFYMQDFANAADCYEQLTLLFPGVEEYTLYYAQALYQVREHAFASLAIYIS